MKKSVFFSLVFSSCSLMFGQQDLGVVGVNNWLQGWTSFKPLTNDYPLTTRILPSVISSDFKLTSYETYLLVGEVYVTNNSTLFIEAGTVIRASAEEFSTLIITKGSKIVAQGLPNNPVVFTSSKSERERRPGDWGGIQILGNAPINTYGGLYKIESDLDASLVMAGGTNSHDSSGVLKNVRVEFAGKGKTKNLVYDAISLIGVGNATVVEAIQSSFSNGNGFKFVGGTLKGSKLFSFRSKNSDFEFTQGANCELNNGLVIRDAFFSSNSEFRGVNVKQFENQGITDFSKPTTTVVLNNFSLVNESEGKSGTNGLIREAVYVNKGCLFTMNKSLITGFHTAVLMSSSVELVESNLNKIKLLNLFINNCKENISSELGGVTNDDLESYYSAKLYGNVYQNVLQADIFNDVNNERTPDYRIKIGGIK
jgi:hypothetical protein